MIEFYVTQKLLGKLDKFVLKEDFETEISYKMDYTVFNDYLKR